MKTVAQGFFLVAVASAAAAQPPGGRGGTDPMDPRAPVPSVVHRSPFAQYRPFAAEVLGPWKAVNDEVGRIGGWKVYAREVYEETKRASPPSEGSGMPSSEPVPGAQRVK